MDMNAFLGEEEAVDDYMMATRLQNRMNPNFAQYWPKGFVPVASPGDGSRLLVNCVQGFANAFGARLLPGPRGGSSLVWRASMGQYFETMLDWLDTGAISVDREGVVRLNMAAAARVASTMNPDCDAWDDAMPPAHVTRDWDSPSEGN